MKFALQSLLPIALNHKLKQYKYIILLILIIIFILYPLLIYPYLEIFPYTDVAIYSAWKEFLVESFRTYGQMPLWNPYLFSGAPFVGNSQVGIFYPVNILYFFLPIDKVFSIIFLTDYILIGIFTYMYARLIKLSNIGALFCSLTMVFNGSIMKHLFLGHLVILDSLTWFPLLLYLYEKYIKKPSLKLGIFSGVVFGLMLLAGNAQIPLYALLAVFIYFTLRNIQQRNKVNYSVKKTLYLPIVTLIIGIGLASIQLLPTLDFSQKSVRGNGIDYQFATDFSFHPKQLPLIVFPSLFGNDFHQNFWGIGSFWGTSLYSGIIPFFLFIIALFFRRNVYTFIFIILIIFSLLYSFGNFGPLFKFFYDHIPFFNNFRVPTRILFVYAFSFSILVGFGIDFINNKIKIIKPKIIYKILFSLSTVQIFWLFVLFILFIFDNEAKLFSHFLNTYNYAQNIDHISLFREIVREIMLFCFFTLSLCISILLLVKKKLKKRIFFVIIIFLIILDFFLYYSKYYFQYKSKKSVTHDGEISYILSDKTKFRVMANSSIGPTITSKLGIENINGYDPLYFKSYRDFLWEVGDHENTPYESFITINNIKNINNLRLLNVKYIITNDTIDNNQLTKVFSDKSNIYKINNSLPRAYISSNRDPKISNNEPLKISEGIIKKYEPNRITIHAYLKEPGFLILSEIYDKDWKAYDNNNFVEIIASNNIFRAVKLSAGIHEVIFLYKPKLFMYGIIVSLTTLFIVALVLTYIFKNEFRKT